MARPIYLFGDHGYLCEYRLEVGPEEQQKEYVKQGYQNDPFRHRFHRHCKGDER